MKYDRAANEKAAISVLSFGGGHQYPLLEWFRLDDGVMGGLSETMHEKGQATQDSSSLHFTGTINTNGGGFASIRARFPPNQYLTKSTRGIKLALKGDGKTYKLLLSQGRQNAGAPTSRTPSWQADIATTACDDDDSWQETVVMFDTLQASFGGGPISSSSWSRSEPPKFDPTTMTEIGFMLSLKLSSGDANPKETFGEGIFPFSLHIKSIEPIGDDSAEEGATTVDEL